MKTFILSKYVLGSFLFAASMPAFGDISYPISEYPLHYQEVKVNDVRIVNAPSVKNFTKENLTILKLNSKDQALEKPEEIVKKIILADTDLVVMQINLSEDNAAMLNAALHEQYPYNFYFNLSDGSQNFSTDHSVDCLFIASKFIIDDMQFFYFDSSIPDANNGFFKFVIKDGEKPIGYIYTTLIQDELSKEAKATKLNQIKEKIKEDRTALGSKEVPFILCQKEVHPNSSKKVNGVIKQNPNPRPSLPVIHDEDRGGRKAIKPKPAPTHHLVIPDVTLGRDEDRRGEREPNDKEYRREVSGGIGCDNKGNVKARGGLGISGETKDGKRYSGGINGEVERTQDGKVNGQVTIDGTYQFSVMHY